MRINVTFNSSGGRCPVAFQGAHHIFSMVFDGAAALREYADYLGSYAVTPMITSQRLETADKHMLNDVLIRTIPTQEMTNAAGGITFAIGGV